jgi:hypothetical protein
VMSRRSWHANSLLPGYTCAESWYRAPLCEYPSPFSFFFFHFNVGDHLMPTPLSPPFSPPKRNLERLCPFWCLFAFKSLLPTKLLLRHFASHNPGTPSPPRTSSSAETECRRNSK